MEMRRYHDELGNVLAGYHDFTGLDHRQRLVLLANLDTVFKATLGAGWHTHTGDWDWFVYLTTVNGQEIETANDTWKYANSKGEVGVDTATVQGGYPSDHPQGVSMMRIQGFGFGPNGEVDYTEENNKVWDIPLEDIVSIRFEEMH